MFISLSLSFLLVFLAYLFGSIPTGYLAGKWLKGIDIRELGSGSTGATNVLRNLGKPAAIAVLGIDVLKGMVAVSLVRGFYELVSTELIPTEWKYWLIFLTGIAAILGHSKSIFLNFTGGKSVATSLGVLTVMNPLVALGALGSFLVMLAISRIVSLSSITAAIAVSILMIALKQPLPYLIFGIIGGIYVIVRHSGNIQRLLAGTEPKLGQKAPATIETESTLPNT
jgi:acyl phosphate:glycerol-3-phosphate acyltransferase